MASTGDTCTRRPWLDGLRAIAVLMVTAEHSGVTQYLALGSAGVALFFALSGYLITGILADELARSDRLDLRRFYVRRVSRLAPALLAMLVICDMLYVAAGQAKAALMSIPAALYAMNYTLLVVPPDGFRQTWTLAIEEHFYLAWPLILLLLWRRGLRFALAATLTLCALDFFYRCLVLAITGNVSLLYMGTPERADSLLYGCAAALAVRLGWRPWKWLAFAAPAFLWWWIYADGNAIALPAVMGACFALVVVSIDRAPGLVGRALSARPLVAIGLRSYGIYLWHTPALGILAALGASQLAGDVASGPIAFTAAWVSYRWLELPAQAWIRGRFSSTSRQPVEPRPAESVAAGRSD